MKGDGWSPSTLCSITIALPAKNKHLKRSQLCWRTVPGADASGDELRQAHRAYATTKGQARVFWTVMVWSPSSICSTTITCQPKISTWNGHRSIGERYLQPMRRAMSFDKTTSCAHVSVRFGFADRRLRFWPLVTCGCQLTAPQAFWCAFSDRL